MKKITLLLCALVFSLQGLAASGQKDASGQEKTTLEFWDENGGAERTPYHEEIIARFEEENPGIEVEYVGIPWNSARQKYDVAIASNLMPDVGGVPARWVSSFAAKKALVSLEPYAAGWEEFQNFSSIAIDGIRALSMDKQLYMLPISGNTPVIWYRSDRLEEAGASLPGDWNDFFALVPRLTDDEKGYKGFSIRGGSSSAFEVTRLMLSYSGITELFTPDGKSTLRDPRNQEFLTRFAGMYKVHTPASDVGNGYKEMVAAFGSGSASMIAHNLGSYGSHLKNLGEGFSAMALPRSPYTGVHNVESGDNLGYAIFSDSKNPDAAWKLVAHYGSEKEDSFFNRQIGQIPANNAVLTHDWLDEADHIKKAMAVFAAEDTSSYAMPQYLPDFSSVVKEMEPLFQQLLLGEIDAESWLATYAEKLEAAQAEWAAIQ